VPKTGSSTIDSILREGNSSLLRLNKTYWGEGNYDRHVRDVQHLVKSIGTNVDRYRSVVSGHFEFPANAESLALQWNVGYIEYMNTIRSCVKRTRSEFVYNLFNSGYATRRKKKGEHIQQNHIKNVLGGVGVSCFANDTCMKEILIAQKSSINYDAVQTSLGNSDCDKYYQSREECVEARLFQPDAPGVGYTVIGLSERMPESLELFKCAFPSYFNLPLSTMSNKTLNSHSSNTSFGKFEEHLRLSENCKIGDSLYEEALRRHKVLLNYVRTYPSCCRSVQHEKQFRGASSVVVAIEDAVYDPPSILYSFNNDATPSKIIFDLSILMLFLLLLLLTNIRQKL
jgi:hypothetical protein